MLIKDFQRVPRLRPYFQDCHEFECHLSLVHCYRSNLPGLRHRAPDAPNLSSTPLWDPFIFKLVEPLKPTASLFLFSVNAPCVTKSWSVCTSILILKRNQIQICVMRARLLVYFTRENASVLNSISHFSNSTFYIFFMVPLFLTGCDISFVWDIWQGIYLFIVHIYIFISFLCIRVHTTIEESTCGNLT